MSNWVATVYDETGAIQCKVTTKGKIQELIKKFDRSTQADKWASLRLIDGASGWYAILQHTSLNIVTKLTRDEAMGAVLGNTKSGPAMHSPKSNPNFQAKVHQTRVTFSHG